MERKTGFTLIEMLVVIGIIALLMAIALPSLARVKRKAAKTVCQSNLRQWGMLFNMYTDDHNKRFFAGYYEYNDGTNNYNSQSGDMWPYAMEPYCGSPEVMFCPLAKRNKGFNSSFSTWGSPDGSPFYGSYGLNAWVCDPPQPVLETEGHETSNSWRKNNISRAASIPVLTDAIWVCGRPEPEDLPPEYEGQPWDEDNGKYVNHLRRYCVNRHDGYDNVLMLDASVKLVALKELWNLKWHRNFNGPAAPLIWPEWMESLPP